MGKYLYNGVELPVLPEWDKATYPYAMMRYSSPTQIVVLHLSTTPLTIDQIGSGILADYWLLGNGAGSTIAYSYSPGDGDIGFKRVESEDDDYDDDGIVVSAYNSYKPRWANYDLYEIDGTLFLDASYPTDAETGEEIRDYEIVVPVLDPLPVSPYLPNNGAWVKHDIYKQVGNTWIKQPQGAVEVEDGAWSALS